MSDQQLNALFDKAIELEVPPLQERAEIIWAMTLAKEYLYRPKRVLEIGSCYGGNLFLLSYLLDDTGLLMAIEPDLETFDKDILANNLSCNLQHIPAYSHDAIVGDNFDLIFYDAGDTYEDIRRDYDSFSPLVRKGGLFMFHDIARVGGTPKLWNELRFDRPYDAKVSSKTDEFRRIVGASGRRPRHTGIGVLYF